MRRFVRTSTEPGKRSSSRIVSLAAQGAALLLTAFVVFFLRVPLSGDTIAKATPPPPPDELVQYRTASSRTFDNHDGTYTTAAYSGPIQYRDDEGNFQAISSALVASGETGYAYENEANRFRALFRQQTGADFLALESWGGRRFRLRLQDAAQSTAQTRPRGLNYPGVFPGVDLRYELQPDGVKETLLLANAQVPTSYRFLLSAPEGARINAVQQSDGSWALYMAPHARPALVLEAPWLSERGDPAPAAPHSSLDVTRVGQDFQLDLSLDGAWLSDPQRQFPVRVDPSLTIQPPTQDASFDFACATCAGVASDRLPIGKSNISPSPIWRSALQFSLADIPPGASVSSATLKLYFDGTCVPITGATCGGTSHQVDVLRMLNSWSKNSKTSQLQFTDPNSPLVSFTLPSGAGAQWMNWNLTSTVQSWYGGGLPNFGLLLKHANEPTTLSGPKPPSRGYAPEPTLGPKLEVTYNGNGGELLEPETVHSNGAELHWIPYAGPGATQFTSYEVHRSASQTFTPSATTLLTIIKDVAVTTYRDTTAKAGATFTYKVLSSGVETNRQTVTLPADGQGRKTLRPDPAAGQDTYITKRSDSVECVNRGAYERLKVGTDAISIWRSLLFFNLGDITPDATISGATLSLWRPTTTSTALNVRAQRLTANWPEGSGIATCTGDGATWYEADGGLRWALDGGDFDPTAAATLSIPSGAQAAWGQWPITSLVQQWSNGTYPNLGILLKLDNETLVAGKSADFYSSDFNVAPTLRPKLLVTYSDGSHAMAPGASVSKPSPGDQVSGSSVVLAASTSDDRRVDSVQFYVDGNAVGTPDTSEPFSVTWNSTSVGNGLRNLTARATDDAGNQTTSAAVSVTVGNSAAPTTSITAPGGGSTVSGTVTVNANASDDVAVTKVEFYADGRLLATDTTSPYSTSWNTLAAALPAYDSSHSLTTKAYDGHKHVTTSAPVSVTVNNAGSSWYHATITTTTAFPPEVHYVPGAPSQEQYDFTVTVTNTSGQTLPRLSVTLKYRWVALDGTTVTTGAAVSFPFDLQPLQAQTVHVLVDPTSLPTGLARTDYLLRFDLYDGANPTNPWFAAHGNPPLENVVVDGVLSEEETLGIEPYFRYDTEGLGAGMESLVNVATGNLVVRWAPFHAPGIGLSSDLELTYNSRETVDPRTCGGTSHAHCPLGPGWSLGVSSLSRFGHQQFYRHGSNDVFLNDVDGTTHHFTKNGTHWDPPAGTHLYLREISTSLCSQQASWALTTPDRVTYFYAISGNGQHGWPAAVQDKNQNTVCFLRSAPDDIVTVTDAGGRQFVLDYASNLLQSITDHTNHKLVFSYDNSDNNSNSGRLVKIVEVGGTNEDCLNPDNHCFQFGYTSGRLETVTDPRGNLTKFTYYTDGTLHQRFNREAIFPNPPHSTTFTYSAATNETTVEKPLGRTTVYHYQADKSVDSVRDALLKTTTTEWWPSRDVKKVTEPAPRYGYTEYSYDQNGLVTEEGTLTDAGAPGPENDIVSRTRYEYDHFQLDQNDPLPGSISQLTTRTDPNGVATDPSPPDDYQSHYFYDSAGNLTRSVDPVGAETLHTYNTNGTLASTTDANTHLTTFENYDTNGFPQLVRQHKLPSDLVTSYVYDPEGLLLTVQDPLHPSQESCPDPRDCETVYTYDNFHRRIEQSSPKSTRFLKGTHIWSETQYDANDNVVLERQLSYAQGQGPATSHIYNKMDQETSITDPEGSTTSNIYDDADRLSKTILPNGAGTTNHDMTENVYDALDRIIEEKRYDENGNPSRRTYSCYQTGSGDLLWVTAPNANWNDNGGLPDCNAQNPQVPPYTSRYTYDDGHRQLTETTQAGEGKPLRTVTQVYDPNGNVVTEINEDGTRTTSEYTQRDELAKTIETFTKDAQNVSTRDLTTAYGYDLAGNLICEAPPRAWDSGSRCDPQAPPGSEPYTTQYRYDEVDQQVRMDLPTAGNQTRTYIHQAYDANGNLTMTSLPVVNTDPSQVPPDKQTTYSYWDPGWIRTSDDHIDKAVLFDYTAEGWERSRSTTRRLGNVMMWEYFRDGMLKRAVDRQGHDANYTYDPDKNITTAVEGRGQEQQQQSHTYKVESIYNGYDEPTKTREKADSQQNWTFTAYSYDLNGNVASRQDDGLETENHTLVQHGRLTLFTYDWVDEQTQQDDLGTDWQDPNPQPSAGDRRLERDYELTGWRKSETLRRYDGSNWVAKRSTGWTYFANGDLASLTTTDPGNPQTPLEQHTLGYEEAGVYVNGNRISDSFTLHGPTGSPTACESPCTTNYKYGVRDNLTQESRTRGGSTSYTCDQLDPAMNVTDEYSSACADTSRVLVRHYDYPLGNRLTQMTDYSGQSQVLRKYSYDDDGNLNCVTIGPLSSTADCPDAFGAPVSSNLEERFTWQYQNQLQCYRRYDSNGQRDKATYTHDPFNRVVTESEQHRNQADRSTNFTYQGLTDLVSSENTGAGGQEKDYTYDADGGLLAMTTGPSGGSPTAEYALAANTHSDVSMLLNLTDDTHRVKASYGYKPYGGEDTGLTQGDQAGFAQTNPYRFNAKRYDVGSSTLDMGARRYNNDIGRFVQQDGFYQSGTDIDLAQDLVVQNRYAFAAADPINLVEFDGHGLKIPGLLKKVLGKFIGTLIRCRGTRCNHNIPRDEAKQVLDRKYGYGDFSTVDTNRALDSFTGQIKVYQLRTGRKFFRYFSEYSRGHFFTEEYRFESPSEVQRELVLDPKYNKATLRQRVTVKKDWVYALFGSIKDSPGRYKQWVGANFDHYRFSPGVSRWWQRPA
jgi:RHS repeat-associated protein